MIYEEFRARCYGTWKYKPSVRANTKSQRISRKNAFEWALGIAGGLLASWLIVGMIEWASHALAGR